MPSRGGASNRTTLIPLALLSAFLFCQTFGALPTAVDDEIARWAGSAVFLVAAVVFGRDQQALWCGASAALAVALNPLYPLELGGDGFTVAKILGGAVAGAAVVRNW
ncbi:MAG: hypothetical protein RI967_592 [Planctomycetota bacterium]